MSFEVVIRRLPPSLTEEQLKEELGGLPEHDFFYFVGSDMRYKKVLFPFVLVHFICVILPAEYCTDRTDHQPLYKNTGTDIFSL